MTEEEKPTIEEIKEMIKKDPKILDSLSPVCRAATVRLIEELAKKERG